MASKSSFGLLFHLLSHPSIFMESSTYMHACIVIVAGSVIVCWLVETDRVVGVDCEIARVNVVAFEHHFKNFWLVHGALLHETYHFVLLRDGLFHIVIELNLDFILNLTGLGEEILVLGWERKVLAILRQQVELADVRPRVESITHWVHSPDAHVFAAPQQVHLVNFAIEILPVE